jgi:hypothetical protein
MPDGDELDAIESTHRLALVNPSGAAAAASATPIVDAEVIEPEPEPDCTDSLDSSSVERASNADRRTYRHRDFER